MSKKDFFIALVIFLTGILSRFPLIEKFQSHWDGPQYSIALVRFSLSQETPASPGYPLYIGLGKLFNFFINSPHLSLLTISALSGALGGLVFFVIGKKIFNTLTGFIASSIFLTGSTFYYFSLTAYPYILTPITSALLAYVSYLIFIKKKRVGLYFGLIVGISFGIRPQETILTWGLMMIGFIYLSTKEKIKSLVVFFVITLFWLIPIILSTGGITEYFFISVKFLRSAVINNTFQQHVELMLKGFLLSFGLSSVFLLYFAFKAIKTKNVIKKNKKIIIFFCFWIIPGLLYNLILRTEHAGYQMTYLAGFLLIISYAIWNESYKHKYIVVSIIFLISIFNLYWFFYDRDPQFVKPYRPTSFHYSDIRKNDLKTGGKIKYIESNFDPNSTLIIATDVLWRPYMYYLKDYRLVDLSGLDIKTPSFKYTRRDSLNWTISQYVDKDMTVAIPKNIKKIVFTDDASFSWIKNYPYNIYSLPGRSRLTSISVDPLDKIIYDYHSLSILKGPKNN